MTKRIAVVTGASDGIGYSCALALAQQGIDIAIVGRNAERLESAADTVRAQGVRCFPVQSDLSKPGGTETVVDRVHEYLGHVDILVNNAGMGSSHALADVATMPEDFWQQSVYMNLTVPFLLSKAFVSEMVTSRFGRIINIASTYSKIGFARGAAYSASKHGLIGLTKSLALEVIAFGVTVNAVCPGGTRTRMSDVKIAREAERIGVSVEELTRRRYPAGRRVEPEEIAASVAFLAHDSAASITGTTVVIDGGLLAG